jgi:predicted nucleic acid-binding protein
MTPSSASAIESRHGYVVKMTGDGFHAVVDTADAAAVPLACVYGDCHESALEQRRQSQPAREVLGSLLRAGAMATCHVIALEVLFSARNRADYETLEADLRASPWLPVTEQAMDRALEVQHRLARRGAHRVPIPDLMIAATAELGGAVLHCDRDFDTIAAVTRQPTQWIVPRGSGG